MDTGRLSQGAMIAGVSAALLVISLFLPWAGIDTQGIAGAVSDDLSGWEANAPIDALDIYLLIVALFALAPAVATMMGGGAIPFASGATTFLLGAIGTLITLYNFLAFPDGLERKFGIFLALLAVIGVTVGGYLSMQEEVGEY
ncbi:MAG: hypothetical protein M3M99_02040 [Actinomycetota bacterium]|nr:hypothetical protein [Actinomycetota bacterium]